LKKQSRVPIGLPASALVLLVLGIAANFIVPSLATPQQLADNVLLNALPFILIFIAIVLGFITFIVFVAGRLSHNVSPTVYRLIETALIAGIVLGVIGMFQSWLFVLYRIGFFMLLASTLGFIVWSHVAPRRKRGASSASE
jgi:hypothetical protein